MQLRFCRGLSLNTTSSSFLSHCISVASRVLIFYFPAKPLFFMSQLISWSEILSCCRCCWSTSQLFVEHPRALIGLWNIYETFVERRSSSGLSWGGENFNGYVSKTGNQLVSTRWSWKRKEMIELEMSTDLALEVMGFWSLEFVEREIDQRLGFKYYIVFYL